jgi:flagellar motor switch protein FliN
MSDVSIENQDQKSSEELNNEEDKEEKNTNTSWEETLSEAKETAQKKELASQGDSNHKKSTKVPDAINTESNESLSSHLHFILDIPLRVSVELGRSRMFIQDLLKINTGSVVELNKQVGEPFDVLVNDKLVARGEVVVVNGRFGVRIVDIISPTERMQQLK